MIFINVGGPMYKYRRSSCLQNPEASQRKKHLYKQVIFSNLEDLNQEPVMTDSPEKQKVARLGPDLHKLDEIINQSSIIEDGIPTRYHLKLKTDSPDQSELYRKMTLGERDKNKPHKTILMLGETGTGKTKLINAMVNYMLGVQREDNVWFEITDDHNEQRNHKPLASQTSIITVYGFYLKESPIDLTMIDTPGYEDTRDIKNEKEMVMRLLSLSRCKDLVHKIDAVCLVIKATQNRLSSKQIYIFDAVQSLFGKDIVENIVLLVTYSRGAHPKNVLMAVEEAKFQCARNDKDQPVYYLFDNCQGETFHSEYQMVQEQSWNLSITGMTGFFQFLDNIKPKSVQMTQDVLQQREQLEKNISIIQSYIQKIDITQNDLKECQDDLEKIKNPEHEANVTYKERVDIDLALAKEAMCCTVCEENCHYPGCWWVKDLSWCSVMKNDHCTICTNKCHHSKHIKEAKIYVTNKEKMNEYRDKIRDHESVVKNLEEELQDLMTEKIKLVFEAFHCVESLQMIALNTESLLILLHVDVLIQRLKEINEPKKVEKLENIKKRAGGEKNKALEYMKRLYEQPSAS